jgi:hypothetical protein
MKNGSPIRGVSDKSNLRVAQKLWFERFPRLMLGNKYGSADDFALLKLY